MSASNQVKSSNINPYLKACWTFEEAEAYLRNGISVKMRDLRSHVWHIGQIVRNNETFKFVGVADYEKTFSEMDESYRFRILHKEVTQALNISSSYTLDELIYLKHTQVAAHCHVMLVGQSVEGIALLNFNKLRQRGNDFIIPATMVYNRMKIEGELRSKKGSTELKILSRQEANQLDPLLLKSNPEYLEDIVC